MSERPALGDGYETPVNPEHDVEMGFFEHLVELRKRLIRIVLGILPAMGICWGFRQELRELVIKPYNVAYRKFLTLEFIEKHGPDVPIDISEAPTLTFLRLTEPFVVYLKLCALGGFLITSPWIFWQIWSFIAPGLYRREKLMAIPFVTFSVLCFVGGAAFAYFLVIEDAIVVLLQEGDGLAVSVQISPYITFVIRMMLAFGIVFEVPVVVTAISSLGLVTYQQLLNFGRWWLVIAAVLAAFLTPPDVVSQLFLLGPLVGLYFLSAGIAFVIDKRRERKLAKEMR